MEAWKINYRDLRPYPIKTKRQELARLKNMIIVTDISGHEEQHSYLLITYLWVWDITYRRVECPIVIDSLTSSAKIIILLDRLCAIYLP